MKVLNKEKWRINDKFEKNSFFCETLHRKQNRFREHIKRQKSSSTHEKFHSISS